MMKNKKVIAGIVALVILLAGAFALYYFLGDKPVSGEKSYTVEVVDDQQQTKTYTAKTKQEYLGDAVKEIDGLTLEGETSTYGFMIHKVNGLSAVYEQDGAYWSVMVNGTYGSAGIDTQTVKDGDVFQFVYTPA